MQIVESYVVAAVNSGVTERKAFSAVQADLQSWQGDLKRFIDVTVSLIAILLLAPLCALIAIAIKLTSGGPVLFRQERIGHEGKPFTILKFRSMTTANDPAIHRDFVRHAIIGRPAVRPSQTKLKDDPRVTRVGRLLRRSCLDEVPQFINVLKGEMSLVGPRPCLPYEYECYEPWHRNRVKAIPGLTGSWQVSDRERISFNEMVKLDIEYVQQWSIWLDLKILLLTPVAVLSGNGAY